MADPAPDPAEDTAAMDSAEDTAAMASPSRPVDPTPVHTDELPPTPQRTRTIPATAWVEAPAELLDLGRRFGGPGGEGPDSADAVAGTAASFLRRVGPWLLWRA
ncbi:MAG: hypothetical protein JWM47_3479, partial [Acidimicrobiales bacterium]|nr:hypothetical protein [Acidimicrobiales bacterium]